MATYKHFKLANVVKAGSNYASTSLINTKPPCFPLSIPLKSMPTPPTLRSKQLSLKLRRLVHVSFVSIFASGGGRAI